MSAADVSGSLFYRPDDGAVPGLPSVWRQPGKLRTNVRSLDSEMAGVRSVAIDDVIAPIVAGLPGGAVELALWLPATAESDRVEVGFRAAAASVTALESIWVEVNEPDGPHTEPDEVRVHDVTTEGQAHLLAELTTSDATPRQEWFISVLRGVPAGRRLRIDLYSRGGIVGLVFARDLIDHLSARDVHIGIAAVGAD